MIGRNEEPNRRVVDAVEDRGRTIMQMMQVRWSLGTATGKRKSSTTDYLPPNKRAGGLGEGEDMAQTMGFTMKPLYQEGYCAIGPSDDTDTAGYCTTH